MSAGSGPESAFGGAAVALLLTLRILEERIEAKGSLIGTLRQLDMVGFTAFAPSVACFC